MAATTSMSYHDFNFTAIHFYADLFYLFHCYHVETIAMMQDASYATVNSPLTALPLRGSEPVYVAYAPYDRLRCALFFNIVSGTTMKKLICIALCVLSLAPLMSACDSPKPQQNGEMYLDTAAKNSAQAKEAEQKVNEAAQKVNADIDAAMKQAETGN